VGGVGEIDVAVARVGSRRSATSNGAASVGSWRRGVPKIFLTRAQEQRGILTCQGSLHLPSSKLVMNRTIRGTFLVTTCVVHFTKHNKHVNICLACLAFSCKTHSPTNAKCDGII
jgi:hypothetical protein